MLVTVLNFLFQRAIFFGLIVDIGAQFKDQMFQSQVVGSKAFRRLPVSVALGIGHAEQLFQIYHLGKRL
ncbi:MAG: hypothetical protein ACC631_07305 [Halocynthiibacter sp.]